MRKAQDTQFAVISANNKVGLQLLRKETIRRITVSLFLILLISMTLDPY